MAKEDRYIRWLEEVGSDDVGLVGDKNASLERDDPQSEEEGNSYPRGLRDDRS